VPADQATIFYSTDTATNARADRFGTIQMAAHAMMSARYARRYTALMTVTIVPKGLTMKIVDYNNGCTCMACQSANLLMEVVTSDMTQDEKYDYITELTEVIIDNIKT
jgi:archaellum component FlaF (FlaF/FlaG flagellin family)